MVNLQIMKEILIKENGKIIKQMGKEYIFMQKEENLMENLKII